MLTLHWIVTGTAVLLAVVAVFRARRLSKRVERLAESYWELRYDHGQLRARLARLEPPAPSGEADAPGSAEQPVPGRESSTSFVPLSSLKR